MRTRAPVLRITVPALCVALVLAGAAGLSRAITTRKRSAPPATVLAVRPAAVRRVTVESNGRHVELAHADGFWRAGAGASVSTSEVALCGVRFVSRHLLRALTACFSSFPAAAWIALKRSLLDPKPASWSP